MPRLIGEKILQFLPCYYKQDKYNIGLCLDQTSAQAVFSLADQNAYSLKTSLLCKERSDGMIIAK